MLSQRKRSLCVLPNPFGYIPNPFGETNSIHKQKSAPLCSKRSAIIMQLLDVGLELFVLSLETLDITLYLADLDVKLLLLGAEALSLLLERYDL